MVARGNTEVISRRSGAGAGVGDVDFSSSYCPEPFRGASDPY